jgi:hypothetical protein
LHAQNGDKSNYGWPDAHEPPRTALSR